VFVRLKATYFKKTLKGVDSTISTLPASVNKAYAQILNKSKDQVMARRALSIILAASRPFTISKINITLNIDNTVKYIDNVNLEKNKDFIESLRNICRLFVLIYYNKIYFFY
jgi:hypothetical protein